MNKLFYITTFYVLIGFIGNAQFTRIINPNLPGKTQTPYSVGTNVFQFENQLSYSQLNQNSIEQTSIANQFKFRYGFWKEKFEAFLTHQISQNQSSAFDASFTGTSEFALGAKYLIFHHIPEENDEVKKSWKKRNSFVRNGLIPDIGISLQYNTPLISNNFKENLFDNGNSISTSIILTNQIAKYISINNQFSLNSLLGELPAFMYSIAGTYALTKRITPYLEFSLQQFYPENIDNLVSYTGTFAIPFALTTDLKIALHYEHTFGNNINGANFGINAAYRINKHVDRWSDKKYQYIEEVIEGGETNLNNGLSEPTPDIDINYAEEQEFSLDPEVRKKQRIQAEKEQKLAEERAEKEAKKAQRKAEREAKKAQRKAEKEAKQLKKENVEEVLIGY